MFTSVLKAANFAWLQKLLSQNVDETEIWDFQIMKIQDMILCLRGNDISDIFQACTIMK